MRRRNTADPNPLLGAHVSLVPVALVAVDHLYEIALATGVGTTWITRGRLVDRARFAELVSGELAFALVPPTTGYVAGHVAVTDVDDRAGTGSLRAFVDPRLGTAALLAGEGIALLVRYAFDHGGLRKLSADVVAGSDPARALHRLARLGPGVSLEGTRRRHVASGSGLVDVEEYAIWPPGPASDGPPEAPEPLPRTLAEMAALLASVAPVPLPDGLTARHRLVADLGLDSLAVAEAVTALDARLGPDGPCAFADEDGELTVGHLLEATRSAP